MQALVLEFRLPMMACPSVVPRFQAALNSTILGRLGGWCPLTSFTGLPCDSPLLSITLKVGNVMKVHSIEEARFAQGDLVEKMAKALDEMHKYVEHRTSKKKQKAVESHNRQVGNWQYGIGILQQSSFPDKWCLCNIIISPYTLGYVGATRNPNNQIYRRKKRKLKRTCIYMITRVESLEIN